MNAVYKNRCYKFAGDSLQHAELADLTTGEKITVPYGDLDLIIEPTDDEWFACENAPEADAHEQEPELPNGEKI